MNSERDLGRAARPDRARSHQPARLRPRQHLPARPRAQRVVVQSRAGQRRDSAVRRAHGDRRQHRHHRRDRSMSATPTAIRASTASSTTRPATARATCWPCRCAISTARSSALSRSSTSASGSFHHARRGVAGALASHAAIAVETAQLIGELRRNQDELAQQNAHLWREVESKYSTHGIIGTGQRIQQVVRLDRTHPRQRGQRADHRRKRHRQGTGRPRRSTTPARGRAGRSWR